MVSNAQIVTKHRKAWLLKAKTPLQIQFGNDPEVAKFVLDAYKYMNWMEVMDVDNLSEVDYREWATIIVREPYADMKDMLGMDSALLKKYTMLHKKYAKLTIPRY